jgi:hypothetical protein
MRLFVSLLAWFLRAMLASRRDLALENLALRQQLATYAGKAERPRLKPEERAFWAALSRVWQGWRSPLVLVKPATVIDWHRRGYQRYWRWRSRRPGRPRMPDEHVAFIRRISSDHPGWGEDRIAEVPAALYRRPPRMDAAVLSVAGIRPERGPRGCAQALAIKLGVKHFEFELESELEAALVSPIQVERILLNLASNARWAMPDGGRLTVSTRNEEVACEQMLAGGWLLPGAYATLSVRDTGAGISRRARRRLFTRGFSTKGSRGLGLATVRQIAEERGGAVNVRSKLHRGTTFEVYLPSCDDRGVNRTSLIRAR